MSHNENNVNGSIESVIDRALTAYDAQVGVTEQQFRQAIGLNGDSKAEDDRGASGASFKLPQLNKALETAAARSFDVLVVREIDRLSRRLAKQLVVEEEFNKYGVQIEYVLGDYPDNPEGALMKNVRAVIAEYERLKIIERMDRGRRLKVKSGSVLAYGRPPYGYKLVQEKGNYLSWNM